MKRLSWMIVFLAGCAAPPPPQVITVTKTIQVPVVCDAAPSITPLRFAPTPPSVVKDEFGVVWVGLTAQGYENLASNIAALRLALTEQRAIIQYYETCLEEAAHGESDATGTSDQGATGNSTPDNSDSG